MFFSTGLILLLTVLDIVVYYLQKQQEEDDVEQKISSPSPSSDQRSAHEGDLDQTRDSSSSVSSYQQCRRFSVAEIKLATHDFDDALVIGKGGFGKVYKGAIEYGAGINVAIKRLNLDSDQGATEFLAEVEMLSKLRHSHIVSLIGYHVESDKQEMILVYEYMPNGSLEDHLYGSKANGSNSCPLTWFQRLNICIGAARGLDYLHTGTGVQCRVLHRDIKSSNILLDENWAGKISDFGLSRTGPAYQSCTTDVYTGQIRGTFGYMDAEYFLTHRLTRKSDVYAFGVVLFEVLCGRPALDFTVDEQQHSLAGWAKHCIREGSIGRIIDPCLRGQISANCLKQFTQIAYKCLLSSKDRPTMSEVVTRLEFALAMALQTHVGRATIIKKMWSLFSIKTSVRAKNYDRNGSKGTDDDNKNKHVIVEEPTTAMALGSLESKNDGIVLEEPTKAAAEESTDNVNKGVMIEESTTTTGGSSDSTKEGSIVNGPSSTAAEGREDATMLKAEPPSSQMGTRNLKIFTFDELRSACRNFRPSAMLGVSYGESVHKGWVDGETYIPSSFGAGIPIAVNMSKMDNVQSLKNWQAYRQGLYS